MQRTEAEMRHLEMIQSVISRLAANSFSVKTWAVGLVAALFGLAVADQKPDARVFLVALLPATAFWTLDAYYLKQERAARRLYDKVNAGSVPSFAIDVKVHADGESWWRAFASPSILALYLPLTLLSVFLGLVVGKF